MLIISNGRFPFSYEKMNYCRNDRYCITSHNYQPLKYPHIFYLYILLCHNDDKKMNDQWKKIHKETVILAEKLVAKIADIKEIIFLEINDTTHETTAFQL